METAGTGAEADTEGVAAEDWLPAVFLREGRGRAAGPKLFPRDFLDATVEGGGKPAVRILPEAADDDEATAVAVPARIALTF